MQDRQKLRVQAYQGRSHAEDAKRQLVDRYRQA